MTISSSEQFLYGFGAVTAFGIWFLCRKYYLSRHNTVNRSIRSMSFSSEGMMKGSFPSQAKVWSPLINILFYFKTCPSIEKLVEICKLLLFYDRFRSAPILINNRWSFIDLGSSIDIEKDLIETIYVEPGKDLIVATDEICAKDFSTDYQNKPIWKIYRIIMQDKKKPSGVLIRIHHAIGDGISLIGTMNRLFETLDGKPYHIDIPEKIGKESSKSFSLNTIFSFVSGFFENLSLAVSPYDSDIAFTSSNKSKMVMSSSRKTVVMPIVKLDFIKAIKNKAGVTVNDVLLAVTAGTIKRYCAAKNDPLVLDSLKPLQNRTLMPVAFPRGTHDINSASKSLRNLWAFISAPMPMNEKTARDRLVAANISMNRLKSSPLAYIQLWIKDNIVVHLPNFLQRQTAYDLFSRHTLVFSNLPGPSEYLNFADEKLLGIQVIFPNLLPQIIIMSYGGNVFFNVNLDDKVVDGNHLLPQLFIEEITELAKSYGVSTAPEEMLSTIL